MSDLRELMETGVGDYAPTPGGLDRTRTKMQRRQRSRRFATIGLALVIGAAGTAVALAAFGRSGAPAVRPPTPAQRAIVLQMRPVRAVVEPGSVRYQTLSATCAGQHSCTSRQLLSRRTVVLYDGARDKYRLGPVILSGADIVPASVSTIHGGAGTRTWTVTFRLSPEGATAFADATQRSVERVPPRNQIAIVVDGRVLSAPAVQSRISSGGGQITGLTRTQAERLVARLGGGSR